MSVERLYVERPICLSNIYLKQLKEKVTSLKQGTDVDDDIGSMTYPAQLDIVADHIRDALHKGATLETGASPEEWEHDNLVLLNQPYYLGSIIQ